MQRNTQDCGCVARLCPSVLNAHSESRSLPFSEGERGRGLAEKRQDGFTRVAANDGHIDAVRRHAHGLGYKRTSAHYVQVRDACRAWGDA
jgi:hypothetical protein